MVLKLNSDALRIKRSTVLGCPNGCGRINAIGLSSGRLEYCVADDVDGLADDVVGPTFGCFRSILLSILFL